jgi:hypothetical protein
MREINEAAALHLAAGALEKRPEVPVGQHDVSGCRVVLTFPGMAFVTRGEGGNKDGTDSKPAPPIELTLDAVLLFIERSEIKGGAKARKRWADCIRDVLKGMKGKPPAEAETALAEVQAKLPPAEPVNRKVAAKRTGADQVKITIEAG